MPTVPRQQGREVLAEPMPGPRNTVSATEETFGGGAANKAVVAATEQLNTTLQNKMARQKALNSSIKTNKLLSLAEQEALNAHYDAKDAEFEEIDPISQKPIKKVAPGGILLANGEQASYGGGSGKRSFDATLSIADKYVAMLDSPEEADRFILRYSKTAQSLNDRASAHEIAQRKAFYNKETDSRLSQIASNPTIPIKERIAEIKSTAYKNGALAGDPKSDADEKIGKAAYEAYESDLYEMFNSRVPNEKAIASLLKDAEDNGGLSPEQISALNRKKATLEEKKRVIGNEEKIKYEESVTTTKLQLENDWKFPYIGEQPKKVGKIAQKGKLAEAEFQKKVVSADKKSATLAAAETNNEAYSDLMLKMVAPGYADEKKRLDHISAYEEGKLAPKDYNKLGDLYAMDPKQKYYASQGLKGLNDKAIQGMKLDPNEKRFLFEKYMELVPKINDKDYRVEDAVDDAVISYGKASGTIPADAKPEDVANASAKMNNGKSVHIQDTGKSTTPKKKPDVTLGAPKLPDSKYKDHPKYSQAVAILKQHRKKVSDKNLKLVLEADGS